MAITDINLSGKVRDDAGAAVADLTVYLLETAANLAGTQETTTTTDANGTWTFTEQTLTETYDIKVVSGSQIRYIPWSDEITLKTVDTSALKVRGVNGAAAPIYLFADRADANIDVWRINAADGGVLTFDNRASGSSDSDLVAQMTITPHATVASSSVLIPGILDVNGSVDWDVTDVQVDSSGDIDLVSTNDAAAAIYLRENAGTSGTIKIHADQGTSVTEGAESINILSDAGGVGIRSTADLAKAINLTSDGGTTGSIAIFNDQGTSVTEGAESISLLSDAGGVGIRSTANLASAINITSDGGTTGSISIFNDQGTSVTEGAESISLLSDAGGVGIRSTANLANAVNITVDGGTTSSMTLFNDQGTSVTEGASSIQLLSDAGGVELKSTANLAKSIKLIADGGTSETIYIQSDQGTSESSIQLLSDAGGIDINAATGKDVDVAGGTVNLTSSDNAAAAIYLRANAGTSETIKIHADQGTGTGSIELLSDAGGIELDAGTDIILDAGGADIFLKDDGTLFGTLTNNSGELLIKSSSSGTTAATFAGADVTFAGAVQIDGNLTVTGTQTIVDTVTMNAANAVVFEGATADGYETTLTIIDPTADRTVYTPNQSGYLPVLAAASTTQISATPEELNVLDAVTAGTVSASLGVVVDSNKDIGSFRNITLTGELDAGSLDVSGDANIAGEVQTTGIGYTDGDNAMTIADGGAVTFPVSIDITGSGGIILENDETITNSTDGRILFSGNIAVPNGGTIGSASDGDAITIPSNGRVYFTQYVGFGDTTPTVAVALEGDAAEESTIQLKQTDSSGHDWKLTSRNDGSFRIADDSAGASRVFCNLTGAVLIGDSANGGMGGVGLTINHGTADDIIFALKSADVTTGLTTAPHGHDVETDDIWTIEKASDSLGGIKWQILADDGALGSPWVVQVWGGTADTAKSSGARGLISFYATEHDGSNTIANVAAGGNLFSVQGNVSGNQCRFLVDEDGMLWATANASSGDVSVGAFSDSYDDAQLVRALDHAKSADGAMGLIRDKWDEFIQYNEQDLVDAGVLGATLADGGLLSVTGLQRLHNGAIWQGYVRQQEMQTRIESLEQKLLALGA
jgi:hypothetical protein